MVQLSEMTYFGILINSVLPIIFIPSSALFLEKRNLLT